MNEVRGLARLQWALPLEFALPAQMLCVFFLLRYLRSGRGAVSKGKFWTDEDLLGFTMALAMICASHFHAVIMAFFLCLVVVVFHATKIREWFFPLTAAVRGSDYRRPYGGRSGLRNSYGALHRLGSRGYPRSR